MVLVCFSVLLIAAIAKPTAVDYNFMKETLSDKSDPEDSFHDKNIIISGENIHKTYLFGLEGVAALRGVSVNIRQG